MANINMKKNKYVCSRMSDYMMIFKEHFRLSSVID